MTREQGLEIIEALFVYEPDFCYHGLKFFFIAPDGTHVSYLDEDTEKVKKYLLSFLETKQGREEIRIDVSRHFQVLHDYLWCHRVWKEKRYTLRHERDFNVYAKSHAPEGLGNIAWYAWTMDFEEDWSRYPQKSSTEKECFVSKVLQVIRDTNFSHKEGQELYTQALRLLIGPTDFLGEPWTLIPNKDIAESITWLIESISDRLLKPSQIPDMYQIGIKANAFSPDPSNPGKYLLTGSMQTAFRTWFDALEKEGYDYSNLPTFSMIRNKFVTEKKHPESSIETALKKVRLERNGKY